MDMLLGELSEIKLENGINQLEDELKEPSNPGALIDQQPHQSNPSKSSSVLFNVLEGHSSIVSEAQEEGDQDVLFEVDVDTKSEIAYDNIEELVEEQSLH